MWPDNRLQDKLNIELPIVQAPMAGASGLDMAIAVSEAGGLGSLACAPMDLPNLRATLTEAGQRTGKPLNINFFAHAAAGADNEADQAWLQRLTPYFQEFGLQPPQTLDAGSIEPFDDERCALVEAFRPTLVSFHFGLPRADLVRRLRAAGIKVLSSATSVAEARWLEQQGCDLIVAQGHEAGGHRGTFMCDDVATQMGSMALVPQIADAVDVPVIAAGGVADGRGIAAAFALGACGVQVGTAYLFTREACISDHYRQALQSEAAKVTAISNVFSGRPARCLVNRMMCEQGVIAPEAPAFPKGFAAIAQLKARAEADGSRDFSPLYCGQAASLGSVTNAAKLTEDLASDAMDCLRRIAGTENK